LWNSITGSPSFTPRASAASSPARALERQQLDVRHLAQAVAPLDVEVLEQEAVGAVRGHEGAAALAPHQDALGHQLVDRVAQRAHRDAQRAGQVGLIGQRLAGAEAAGLDGLQQRALGLPVQRLAGSVRRQRREDARGRAGTGIGAGRRHVGRDPSTVAHRSRKSYK
jgi:hypothetical protein